MSAFYYVFEFNALTFARSMAIGIYTSDLTLMTVKSVQQACRESSEYRQEKVFINELLRILKIVSKVDIRRNLEDLFNHKRANVYLFDVTLDDQECLFAKLFEIPTVRDVILESFILQRACFLTKYISNRALNRNSNRDRCLSPIFWLCGSDIGAKFIKHLITEDSYISCFEIVSLLMPIKASDYYRASIPTAFNVFARTDYIPCITAEINALMCILLTEAGRWIINGMLILPEGNFIPGKEALSSKLFVDLNANKERVNMLRILSRTASGCELLSTIILRQDGWKNIIIDTDALLDGLTLKNDFYEGECVLVNLMKHKPDILTNITTLGATFDIKRITMIRSQMRTQHSPRLFAQNSSVNASSAPATGYSL